MQITIMVKTCLTLFLLTIFVSVFGQTGIKTEDTTSYIDCSKLFSVYELSPKTTAIVTNLGDGETSSTIFDSIFNQISLTDSLGYSMWDTLKNCYYFDTTGEYRLVKSDKLETEIRKKLDSEYYIYGTKGVVKVKIKDIVFGLEECRTNILAFSISKFDTTRLGHPLIGSAQKLNLLFGKDYGKAENKINEFYRKQISDYTDSIPTKVFANVGPVYFGYNDDFLWGEFPERRKCFFPSREVFILNRDETVKVMWGDGLDLFGIPCD
jgi:hypothetical protein